MRRVPKKIQKKIEPIEKSVMDKKAKVDINMIDKKLSWFSISDYKTRYYRRFKAHILLVCNFELTNGHHTTCVLPIKDGRVVYNEGAYIVDDALKYYHIGFKEYCLDYHEGFALPIKRKFPLNDINVALQESGIGNIGFATNPTTLRTFQVNDVVKSAIQAAGINDFFKQIRLLVIISAIASVITLLLWANEAGYFSRLTG